MRVSCWQLTTTRDSPNDILTGHQFLRSRESSCDKERRGFLLVVIAAALRTALSVLHTLPAEDRASTFPPIILGGMISVLVRLACKFSPHSHKLDLVDLLLHSLVIGSRQPVEQGIVLQMVC